MDVNKIFKFFKSEDEIVNNTQVVLYDNPAIWIGMFKKLIYNYEVFTKQIIFQLRISNPDLDMDNVERASSNMIYNRAYDNIIKIDINNPLHLEVLNFYSDEHLKISLKKIINYFEDIEEYEKCIILKQIFDKINFSQE